MKNNYKPKYPNLPFLLVADMVNKATGKTYREENAELVHNIPVGTLVEVIETGIRLFVVHHSRDCDQTPLYCLAVDPEDIQQVTPYFLNAKWHDGYVEEDLQLIKSLELVP